MTARARDLRRDSTLMERLLWRLLRDRQLAGLKFRRQHVLGPFILDFYCPSARIAVEVDGRSHDDPHADEQRDQYLRAAGVRVVRVRNDQVLYQREAVLATILREAQQPSPQPSPLQGRGRDT